MGLYDGNISQKIEVWSERERKAFGYLSLFVYLLIRGQSASLPAAVSHLAAWQAVKLLAGVGCVISFGLYVISHALVQRLTGNIWANPLWSCRFKHFVPLLIGLTFFEMIILGSRMLER